METNYVEDFVSKFVSVMQRAELGGYDQWGSYYHVLLDRYNEVMRLADESNSEKIKEAKNEFDTELREIQQGLEQAWNAFFPEQDYPKQSSIHGLNIVINKIIEKINSGSRKAMRE